MEQLFYKNRVPLSKEDYLKVAPVEKRTEVSYSSNRIGWDVYQITMHHIRMEYDRNGETKIKKEDIKNYLIYSKGCSKAIEPSTGKLFIPVFKNGDFVFWEPEVVGFMPSMKEDGYHECI